MSEPLRFFVAPELLFGEQVTITGEPLHHLQNVLRLQAGAEILLLDGLGTCCLARLESLQRKLALARVERRWTSHETAYPVSLLQALPKGDKFDLVLQKGTELGVKAFQPLTTRRSVPSPATMRLATREQRWRRIVQEACRQSRRDLLPELRPLRTLAEALDTLPAAALKLALWEEGASPLANLLPPEPPEEVILLVGPEGGFGADEIAEAAAAGFQPVHLGPRILRTETAGLAVTPVLQYLYGDWTTSPTVANEQKSEESR